MECLDLERDKAKMKEIFYQAKALVFELDMERSKVNRDIIQDEIERLSNELEILSDKVFDGGSK